MRFPGLLLFPILLGAQDASQAARAARQWRESHQQAILSEFLELLSIPNVARNLDDMRRNASYIRRMMEKRGIKTELLEVPNSPAAIYGEMLTPGARQTVMFYVHYDGQPVEPSQWSVTQPFQPLVRDGRIYARSASDDKAPVLSLMTALDAFRNAGIALRSNIKFFLDGEEEAGSPHLNSILSGHKDKLAADVWIFCDGPVHQTRRQQVVFGVRGSTGLNITVYGPRCELHSGHYGNWAPNPVVMLAHLIAGMRDEDGRIKINGFYDDVEPLSESERKAIAAMPDIEAGLREELLLGRTEGGGKRLEELITLPALNVRGIEAAGVGSQSRNVVPATATVSIDIRLVKGMDHRRALDKLVEHIRRQGYHVVTTEPDEATRLKYPKVCKVAVREQGYNAVGTGSRRWRRC